MTVPYRKDLISKTLFPLRFAFQKQVLKNLCQARSQASGRAYSGNDVWAFKRNFENMSRLSHPYQKGKAQFQMLNLNDWNCEKILDLDFRDVKSKLLNYDSQLVLLEHVDISAMFW